MRVHEASHHSATTATRDGVCRTALPRTLVRINAPNQKKNSVGWIRNKQKKRDLFEQRIARISESNRLQLFLPLTSKSPFFNHVNASSVPLAQQSGFAWYSGGADCEHEHRLGLSGWEMIPSILSSAAMGSMLELIIVALASSVSICQSACKLSRMVCDASCMFVLMSRVRSKLAPCDGGVRKCL